MPEPVCWIDDIDYRDANPMLRSIYDQVLSPNGQLDKLYRGFSLSPQTILPADTLYKAALHHSNNCLPKVFAELIGTYVAILTGCDYAYAHHSHNYVALSADSKVAHRVLDNLRVDCSGTVANRNSQNDANIDACGTEKEVAALKYVRVLCLHPAAIAKDDIDALRTVHWSDSEISEIVQVVAMFSYFVRVINGVGIDPGDEKLGLY